MLIKFLIKCFERRALRRALVWGTAVDRAAAQRMWGGGGHERPQ